MRSYPLGIMAFVAAYGSVWLVVVCPLHLLWWRKLSVEEQRAKHGYLVIARALATLMGAALGGYALWWFAGRTGSGY